MKISSDDLLKLEQLFDEFKIEKVSDTIIEKTINSSKPLKDLLKRIFESYEKSKTISVDELKIIDDINTSKLVKRILKKYIEISNYTIIDETFDILDIDEVLSSKEVNNDLTDSFKIYLNEIGKNPLLTADEEKELFQKYKYNNDKNAYKKLCESNLRLVVSVAKKYAIYGVPYDDLVQEGNIGLIQAIQRFDLKKECKLSTYAVWWIRQAIVRYLYNKRRMIRLPVHLLEVISKVKKSRNEYMNLHDGKSPSIEELEKITGLSRSIIERCLSNEMDSVSLDEIVSNNDEKSVTLKDFIADENENIDDHIDNLELQEKLQDILLNITNEMERNILTLRFGLGGAPTKTVKEIAKEYGTIPERVRMIEAMALRKLRRTKKTEKLKEYCK